METVMDMARKVLGPSHYDETSVLHGLIGSQPGVMIDVGAHHGTTLAPFAADGWTIYAFEPDPVNRAVLTAATKKLPNVHVDERAISEIDGDTMTLYNSDVSTGISTLTPFHESHQPVATVVTTRLDTWAKESAVQSVDFLKCDTEGHDLFVLRTFPWQSHRPAAVVCEFEDRKTRPLGYTANDLAQFLVQKQYAVIVSEWHPVVEYGQTHRWRSAYPYAGALAGVGAWGNFVAVEPNQARVTLRALQNAGRRLKVRQVVDRLRGGLSRR